MKNISAPKKFFAQSKFILLIPFSHKHYKAPLYGYKNTCVIYTFSCYDR